MELLHRPGEQSSSAECTHMRYNTQGVALIVSDIIWDIHLNVKCRPLIVRFSDPKHIVAFGCTVCTGFA